MRKLQLIRNAVLALSLGMALVASVAAPAAAAKTNTFGGSGRAGLGTGSAASSLVRQQLKLPVTGATTGARAAAGPPATTCTASVGAPELIGNGQVRVPYGVSCDNQVDRFLGAVGIARNGTELLGGTIDIIDARGSGFSFAITRTCASGVLYGDLLVQVTFRNGTPRQITGEFFGPAVEVTC
ncbi:hypothetical protein BJY16_006507 [Actinoplanes octamycinicus]|uniref:Secreted protein n=1 Tax=Actinoplanes octamycinicus TaxID=135948 RepID=A0A7W7H348_9ACTN|nr:hypothetical protein [Actinoplanes octamycinicus]MBB4743048.1 hypothetical protein [Actinoplanes octamycinicus]GIE58097.1 hypothetical protein Aoc01nite_34990 [Actinoplanes octamycinicus]